MNGINGTSVPQVDQQGQLSNACLRANQIWRHRRCTPLALMPLMASKVRFLINHSQLTPVGQNVPGSLIVVFPRQG
ncbi:MAG: hypothetical protein ACOYLM_07785 [Methylococcaceae bacterium]